MIQTLIKYKGTYRVYLPKLDNGNTTPNEEDTYLKCKGNKATLHRYNEDTLKIFFTSTGYANNRVKELTETGVQLTLYQDCDGESTYLFPESDLSKVVTILTPSTSGANKSPRVNANRKKKEYTEEEKQVLRERMLKIRKNIKKEGKILID